MASAWYNASRYGEGYFWVKLVVCGLNLLTARLVRATVGSMQTKLPLFHFHLYRTSPHEHDMACRRLERKLRCERSETADWLTRRNAIAVKASRRYPWSAQRCGLVSVDLEGERFVVTLYLCDDTSPVLQERPGQAHYRARRELGTLQDEPGMLRSAMEAVPEWVAEFVPPTVYLDTAMYDTLVEHFDFRRFRSDYLTFMPRGNAVDRQRRWN